MNIQGEDRRRLDQGLRELGLPEDDRTAEKLLGYLVLLEKWNRVHNLTSIRDVPSMISAHLLDSLSALPFVSGESLLDVGSGAGLPGLPLAIVRPSLSTTLLDSRNKKTRFLEHVVVSLALENVTVICERAERYRPQQKFDTLVTRAFSSIADFVDKAGHLCSRRGRLIALKGRYPQAELADVYEDGFEVNEIVPVSVPGLDAERHIVVLTPS